MALELQVSQSLPTPTPTPTPRPRQSSLHRLHTHPPTLARRRRLHRRRKALDLRNQANGEDFHGAYVHTPDERKALLDKAGYWHFL
jgi:hypothetical protein